MSARLPVILHASEHYRWLVGSEQSLVDLSVEGNLAHKVDEVLNHPDISSEIIERNYENALRRFDWPVLKDRYLDMYKYALGSHLNESLV